MNITDEQFAALVGLKLMDMGARSREIDACHSRIIVSRHYQPNPNDIRPVVAEIFDMIMEARDNM